MLNPITRVRIDSCIRASLFLCAGTTILVSAIIVWMLGKESYEFFSQVPILDFLLGTKWTPLLEPKSFGVLPLVNGTFLITFGAILLALPLGILIAIYLSEISKKKIRTVIKPILEVLAGIPTIVYGYFALTFITPVIKVFFPQTGIFNALSGAIVVGVMILPMIASLCDDAFQALPGELKEGAYALGATRFEVISNIILPASLSRIGSATILATSRAIGETMAVTLAAGANPKLTANPLESIQTMTAYIVQVSLGDIPAHGIEYKTCFAVAALLFVLTLSLNIIGHKLISRKDF